MIGFEEVIKYFSEVSTEKGQLVHHEKISGQEVSHGDLDHELPDALMEILVAKKMFPFYSARTEGGGFGVTEELSQRFHPHYPDRFFDT